MWIFAQWLSACFLMVRVAQCPCLAGYQRYEKRAVAFFIAKSWVLAIICASATTYIHKYPNNIFAVTIPGCFDSIYFPSTFNLCATVWIGCTLFGFCLPLFFICNNCFMTTSQMQSRVQPCLRGVAQDKPKSVDAEWQMMTTHLLLVSYSTSTLSNSSFIGAPHPRTLSNSS